MAGPIICAKCEKILSNSEIENGHDCRKTYYINRQAQEDSKQASIANQDINLKICPACGHKSLFWNDRNKYYECLDTCCERRVSEFELSGQNCVDTSAHKKDNINGERKKSQDTNLVSKTANKRLPVLLFGFTCFAIAVIYLSLFSWPSHQTKLENHDYIGEKNRSENITAFIRNSPVPGVSQRDSTGTDTTLAPRPANIPGAILQITPSPAGQEQVKETVPASALSPTKVMETGQVLTSVPVISNSTVRSFPETVKYVLSLINKDRAESGLAPVILGDNVAAQKHAEDLLAKGYLSHWGVDGMKPYMRFTLEGGFNYSAENISGPNTLIDEKSQFEKRDIKAGLEKAQKGFMSSQGHRENILNKWHRKVNIGIAHNSMVEAVVQDFEGDYIRFSQLPSIENGILSMSGETLEGFTVNVVQVWYDPLPQVLTLGQLGQTYAYNMGKPVAFIRPLPQQGWHYTTYTTAYSWTTQGPDPYSIPPETLPPAPNPFGTRPEYPVEVHTINVVWRDAKEWNVSKGAFSIKADLTNIISVVDKGVYTVLVWGKNGDESLSLTNYSIFVR